MQLVPGALGVANGSGGLDSVYKSVTVNGASYSYYYDATNKRRLKLYPTGDKDEFFTSYSGQPQVEVGFDVLGGATSRPTDEYVYLGGRPVVVVRGRLSLAYARQSDATVACGRNGQSTACGPYFLVTDYLQKPVAVLDSSRKVSSFADMEAFGEVNRVALAKYKHGQPIRSQQQRRTGDGEFGKVAGCARAKPSALPIRHGWIRKGRVSGAPRRSAGECVDVDRYAGECGGQQGGRPPPR